MAGIRKPFQGVGNIVRFNWHFYLLSVLLMILLFFVTKVPGFRYTVYATILFLLLVATLLTSLLVSFYVYDLSPLYSFSWLDKARMNPGNKILNIHAGFDETSSLLHAKYPDAELTVLDFYDPLKHTEISIKRARRAYPPYPNTQATNTVNIPLRTMLPTPFM